VERDFGDVLTLIPSAAGLHVSAYSAVPARPVARAARGAGLWLYTLGDFTEPRDAVEGFVFGSGAVAPEDIEPGPRCLRDLL